MSWIKEADLEDQGLPAIFQAMSLNPEALESVKRLNETLAFGGSGLTRVQEEAIATVVAAANQCRYEAMTHSGFLRRHSGDEELASSLLSDYTQVNLSPADRRMLDFAVQLTRKPASVTRDDVEGLRGAGFNNEKILSIVLLTCLCNFMNRLADSLGVDVPAEYQKAAEQRLAGPAAHQEWLMRPKER
jgi:uncharacterized peroxidase-related enzyme